MRYDSVVGADGGVDLRGNTLRGGHGSLHDLGKIGECVVRKASRALALG